MSRLKAFGGYALAALAVPILLATFMGMPNWAGLLVSVTGVTVSPWFSGGDVAQVVSHGDYEMHIHRPVFQALIGERREGFVQVDWTPLANLPARLVEEVDVNGDGQADFRVELDTRSHQAVLMPRASWVIGLQGTYRLKEAEAIRVALRNPAR
jgi:hypothetical protein